MQGGKRKVTQREGEGEGEGEGEAEGEAEGEGERRVGSPCEKEEESQHKRASE
jgi:hypothetical protein